MLLYAAAYFLLTYRNVVYPQCSDTIVVTYLLVLLVNYVK